MATLRKRSEEQDWLYPQTWGLVHRGADPRVVKEIVAAMSTRAQTVEVLGDCTGEPSFAELRNELRRAIENGHRQFIVLLTEKFPGTALHQTLGPIRTRYGTSVSFYPVCVESCELGNASPVIDISGTRNSTKRRQEILRLAPTRMQASVNVVESVAAISTLFKRH